MWPKPRLGKRSPLGELLSAPYPAGGPPTGRIPAEADTALATGAWQLSSGRVKGHHVLKFCFQHGEGGGRGVQGGFEPTVVVKEKLQPCGRPTSASIDVPGRRWRSHKGEVEVDELMAAMVLSSLSSSPLLHGPAHLDTVVPPLDCRGSKLSEGGSSSGYWSSGHGSESPATPPDKCLDVESRWVPSDELAAIKRRNSAYRCLWPGCDKVLTTIIRIKRHIRNTHLSSDHQRNEEDFYYTEASQWESPTPSLPLPLPFSPGRLSSSPSPPPPSPALSRSAPSSFNTSLQVQSEHSYQGQASPARSIFVDQWLQQHSSAPSRISALCASKHPRLRGDAKKCRRVYGIEQRELWCTSCRWKKACQRFLS